MENQNKQNIENVNQEGNCPICGYFAGPRPTCMRCGARIKRKFSIVLARRIAVIGSIIGVILFWIAVKTKEPKLVKIDQISETMSNAYVKLQGKVTQVKIDEEKNNYGFTINDGTGKITVRCFNKLDRFKEVLGDDLPNVGDIVQVKGSLQVSQQFGSSMFLSVPDRVKIIEKFKINKKLLQDISVDDEGGIYKLNVTLVKYETFTTRSGYKLHKFLLRDESTEKEMVLFDSSFQQMDPETQSLLTTKGNVLELIVTIGLYKGEPQIKLFSQSSEKPVKKIGETEVKTDYSSYKSSSSSSSYNNNYKQKSYSKKTYTKKSYTKKIVDLGSITNSMKGKFVNFKATVTGIRNIGSGTILTIKDGTGKLSLIVWNKQKFDGFDEQIREGVDIEGYAVVDEYRGNIQLKVVKQDGITVK